MAEYKSNKNNMESRVLVIGGRGFLGGHVCRELLNQGYRLLVHTSGSGEFDNLADILPNPNVEILNVKLNDYNSLAEAASKCTYMVHCALPYAIKTLGQNREQERERRDLRRLLDATASISRTVIVSACGTIGTSEAGLADETMAPDSLGFYSSLENKILMEKIVLAENRPGREVIVVNPSLLVGTHDTKPSSGELMKFLAQSPVGYLAEQKINIVGAKEVASGIASALEKGRGGERYLLTGVNTTVYELHSKVRELSGKSKPSLQLPVAVVTMMSLVSELLSWIFNTKKPAIPLMGINLIRYGSQHYSCEKAVVELGYDPKDAWKALADGCEWYRMHHILPSLPRKALLKEIAGLTNMGLEQNLVESKSQDQDTISK